MLRIRLKRLGAKKRPFYRIVVADGRKPRDGRVVEELGWYDPLPSPSRVKVDVETAKGWIAKGARPSETVVRLLNQVEAGKLTNGAPEAVPVAEVETAAAPEPEAMVQEAVSAEAEEAAPVEAEEAATAEAEEAE